MAERAAAPPGPSAPVLRLARLPARPPNPVVDGLLHDFGRVASLFPHDPHDPASFARRAERVDALFGADRAALAAALVRQNEALGAAAPALRNAARLADPRALAVVTGQQAGILTGPLYTVWKCLTAVRLARRLEVELERPVVPVFWIAAEDHDFAEAAAVHVVDREHRLHRIALEMEVPGRVSMGHLTLAPERAVAVVEQLAEATNPSEFRDAQLERLRALAVPGGTVADWFGRVMAWLFSGHGVVLANPLDPALRTMQGWVFTGALQEADRITAALAAAAARVRALGAEPQVEPDPGSAYCFLYVDGQRLALAAEGDGFAARGGGWFSRAELLRLAAEDPMRFSANVVTRPVTQDAILPTVAYVAGPGEISYHALYREVFALFGRELPVIYPRAGVTLVERSYAGHLDKFGLALDDVAEGAEALVRRHLAAHDPVGIAPLFEALRADITAGYARVRERLAALDGELARLGEENLARVLDQTRWLEGKAAQRLRESSRTTAGQLEKLVNHLWPGGEPQERVLNVFPYLFRYGTGLLDAVLALPIDEGPERKQIVIGG